MHDGGRTSRWNLESSRRVGTRTCHARPSTPDHLARFAAVALLALRLHGLLIPYAGGDAIDCTLLHIGALTYSRPHVTETLLARCTDSSYKNVRIAACVECGLCFFGMRHLRTAERCSSSSGHVGSLREGGSVCNLRTLEAVKVADYMVKGGSPDATSETRFLQR